MTKQTRRSGVRPLAFIGAALGLLQLALGGTAATAGVDDFSYDRWDVSYELGLDDAGRAVARVEETLVARFPETDQNRGIVRALPLRYAGAPAAPEELRVHDGTGERVPFEVEDEDPFRMILLGDARFVHGVQRYVISYTLHDPVLAATETNADEFYWDLVPLERRQDIAAFSAEIILTPPLADRLTGESACYFGPAGRTDRCEFEPTVTRPDGTVVMAIADFPLRAGSGVTAAIGMEPGTVAQPPERLPNFALDVLPMLLAAAALSLGVVGAVLVVRMKRARRSFRGLIVAQYDVPEYLPPLLAGPLVAHGRSPVAAEFVHLAVTGAVRVEETAAEPGLFGSAEPNPALRLLDPERARDPLDRQTVAELFSGSPAGTLFALPKKDEKFGERMQSLTAAGVLAATARGYFTRERNRPAVRLAIGALVLIAAVAILLVLGSSREWGLFAGLAIALGVLALALAIVGLVSHRVFTPSGAETREYLEGVREFIRVAEADRIRVLQSHSGAERTSDGGVDVVQLYERLLPYAMLFGQEKEWGRVLEVAYHEQGVTVPLWYPALGVHGLSVLDRSLSSFSSTLTSAAGYTASSSGGSTGGGFSGGGGGGGFSGGR